MLIFLDTCCSVSHIWLIRLLCFLKTHLRHDTGVWSRRSWVNKIISSVYGALCNVSQPWQTEPCGAYTVQKDIIISNVITIIAIHLSSSFCLQHMGARVGKHHGVSAQAEHKPRSNSSQQLCARLSLTHCVTGTEVLGGSRVPLIQPHNEKPSCLAGLRECLLPWIWADVCVLMHQPRV